MKRQNQARVSQFISKLADARRMVVHVASSQRSRRDKAEDEQVDAMNCIKPFYSKIIILIVLGPIGNLVFYVGL
jgi:hypothetical protein